MLVNQMQRDLNSSSVLEVCAALIACTNLITSNMAHEERSIHPSTKPNVREQIERTTSSRSSPSKEPQIGLPMGRPSGTERSIWNKQDMLQNLLLDRDQDETCSNTSIYGSDDDDDKDGITDDDDSNASGYGIDDDCNYVTTISAQNRTIKEKVDVIFNSCDVDLSNHLDLPELPYTLQALGPGGNIEQIRDMNNIRIEEAPHGNAGAVFSRSWHPRVTG